MNKRALQGWFMIVVSMFLFVFYTYFLFLGPSELRVRMVDLTVYILVILILASVAYVGYIFVKTPTLKPEEIYELLRRKKNSGSLDK
uniref:Uncharacterized protein n=1 Tax=Thermogladius calderae TaxID=1200300 RepID=A0A7J3Y0M3_9CREN